MSAEQGDVGVIREALGGTMYAAGEKRQDAFAALDRLAAALDKLKGENYALTHGRHAEAWNELQAALERAERERDRLIENVQACNERSRNLAEKADRAEKAERALAEMREALTYIEWVWDGREDTCPSCGISEHAGHDSSCRTDAALRPSEETEAEKEQANRERERRAILDTSPFEEVSE